MKNHSIKFLVSLLMIFFVTLSSCLKDKEEEYKRREQEKLKEYLREHNITTSPTASGLYILADTEGTGASPSEGEFVDFDYTLTTLEDGVVQITTDSSVARDNDIYSGGVLYGPARLQIGTNIDGLDEGLVNMKEGGRATLIIPSSLAWGNSPYSQVGSYKTVIIDITLYRVLFDPAVYERSLINEYLAENDISTDSTDIGIYVIENEAGTSDSADIDRQMTGYIRGTLLDGKEFLPRSQFRTVIASEKSIIFTEGLKEGIKAMTVGEKATIIVPYYRGYQKTGVYIDNNSVRVPIPPYAALKYEVEVVSVN